MIKEQGLVVGIQNEQAMVQTISKASCNSCQVNSSCGTGIISKAFGERSFITPMFNSIKAQKGDHVEVGIPEDLMVKTSLLVYLMPLLSMIITVLSVQWLFPNASEILLILVAVLALSLGFLLVRKLGEIINKNKPLEPTMLRIVKRPIDVKHIDTI